MTPGGRPRQILSHGPLSRGSDYILSLITPESSAVLTVSRSAWEARDTVGPRRVRPADV